MKFKSVPIFEIVRLIDLQPPGQTGFCMLVSPSADADLITELRAELHLQIAGSLGEVDVKGLTAVALAEQLRTRQDTTILMYGFESWSDEQFASLDVNRSRLASGAFLLFCVDLVTAGHFLNRAPNVRSFLGANIFVITPDPSSMKPDEIADRLDQLRTHYGLSDAEVISRASSGDLPPEPHFIEWLVLLGRSELVHQTLE